MFETAVNKVFTHKKRERVTKHVLPTFAQTSSRAHINMFEATLNKVRATLEFNEGVSAPTNCTIAIPPLFQPVASNCASNLFQHVVCVNQDLSHTSRSNIEYTAHAHNVWMCVYMYVCVCMCSLDQQQLVEHNNWRCQLLYTRCGCESQIRESASEYSGNESLSLSLCVSVRVYVKEAKHN